MSEIQRVQLTLDVHSIDGAELTQLHVRIVLLSAAAKLGLFDNVVQVDPVSLAIDGREVLAT
jgi:hypothetical protein